MFCFWFSCADLLHGNCLLTGFNFSIKILFAKVTFLFWILLCHLLNMSSFCIGSISWCCFVVTLFLCSSHVPLFSGIPIVLPVFCCSAIVPVFCRCSVFRSSVFWCFWFYSMPFRISHTLKENLTKRVSVRKEKNSKIKIFISSLFQGKKSWGVNSNMVFP